MPFPLEIIFRNLPPSEAVEAAIRRRAAKLERFANDIMNCRVTVEAPHQHHQHGQLYRVAVDLHLRGREIVADRNPYRHTAHEDVYVSVRDAFRAARRQLQDAVRMRRGEVKAHAVRPPRRASGDLEQ